MEPPSDPNWLYSDYESRKDAATMAKYFAKRLDLLNEKEWKCKSCGTISKQILEAESGIELTCIKQSPYASWKCEARSNLK